MDDQDPVSPGFEGDEPESNLGSDRSNTVESNSDANPVEAAQPGGMVTVPQPNGDPVAGSAIDAPGGSADGRGRRRTALAIVIAAILAGAAGMFVGSRIESPADRAAARAAPPPSLITVPVERRALSSELVLNGEVAYNEPTPIELAGPVALSADETAVVTRAPSVGDEINEGAVILEVTGRPVFALQGELPMYRRMVIGTEGPDVLQLETALARLGFDLGGEPDPVFDAATAAAVDQMYVDAGFDSQGPSDEQQSEIEAAKAELESANQTLTEARKSLSEANQPLAASERLQLERSRDQAREAVPTAEAGLVAVTQQQDIFVAAATQTRDNATNAVNAANNLLNAARTGAIDPDTGQPYAAPRIAELEAEVAAARQALTDAELARVTAVSDRDAAIAAARSAIDDAKFNLQLAEAQYNEGTTNADTSGLQDAVTQAENAAKQAQTNLTNMEASSGTRVAAGEIVFAPVLPTDVIESFTSVGAAAEGQLATIATSETLVRARVSRADSGLVSVGSQVEIEVRDAGVNLPGSVLSVGAPAPVGGNQGGDGGPGGGEAVGGPGGGGASGRLEVVVAPTEGAGLNNYVFYGARVRVTIDSTDGEVLVVPVAALTVGPDEQDQVEIEVTPATDTTDAVTDIVAVNVGLSANGLAEVEPVEPNSLVEGDRVVIGFEWEDRQVGDNRDVDVDSDGDSPEPDDSSPGNNEENSDAGNDETSDDADKDEAGSPLDALFGGTTDPVAQRAQQLEIEEAVAECMAAEGFEYKPVDYTAQFDNQAPEEQWGTEAFGEKHGYGVMYSYELYELNPEVSPEDQFVDPNQDYVENLGPAEQEAYFAALHGEPIESETIDSTIVPSLEEQGCYGQAQADIAGPDPYSDPAIAAELDDFFTNVDNDPALQDLNQKWAACMATTLEGLDVPVEPTNPNEMYGVAEALKANVVGQEIVAVNSEAELEEYFDSGQEIGGASTNEDGTGYVILGAAEEVSGAEIDAATEREVELWKADQACLDEIGYMELRRQIEQEFVDRLLEQFPQLGS